MQEAFVRVLQLIFCSKNKSEKRNPKKTYFFPKLFLLTRTKHVSTTLQESFAQTRPNSVTLWKIPQTPWLQFWEAWLKKIAWTLENSRLKTKVNFSYYTFFRKMFFVGKFLLYVRCSFGNPSEFFWVKTTEKILTNSKNGYSTEFSSKINHASKKSSGHVKRSFKKPAENMSPKSPKICQSKTKSVYLVEISLKSNLKYKKNMVFENLFLMDCSSGHKKCSSDNPEGNILE